MMDTIIENKTLDKLSVTAGKYNPCDDIIIDYIDSLGSNIANLRQDFRIIVREELTKLLRELRKPKPYVEVGYRS
jgi:hypothetical protein